MTMALKGLVCSFRWSNGPISLRPTHPLCTSELHWKPIQGPTILLMERVIYCFTHPLCTSDFFVIINLKSPLYIPFYQFFSHKVVLSYRSGFLICFSCFRCRLVVVCGLFYFDKMICFSLSCCDVHLYVRFK